MGTALESNATINLLGKLPELRVVQGATGLHHEGRAVARVVAEPQQPANGRCIIYVFGEQREDLAQLIARAPDHALWGAAAAADVAGITFNGLLRVGHGSSVRHFSCSLDAFKCPFLTEETRDALHEALGLEVRHAG